MESEKASSMGKFLDPKAIIAQLMLPKGSFVADFGCGPGFFSIPFAETIGESGKVYSLDILPQALETIESKIKNSAITNIITKRANIEKENGSKLESNSLDWVILKDVLFQNQKKDVIIQEAYRILKPGGKVLVVEWNQVDAGIGPEMNIRVSQNDIEKIFEKLNFRIEKQINAGDFHYAFVAVKIGE